jgi:Leucine Rich repeats (2 copies)
MSEPQPKPSIDFNNFADWYFHKDSLSDSAKHTVEVLFKSARYADVNEGIRIVSAKDNLNLSSQKISDLTPFQSLTHLSQLYLQNNQISDLSPLQNLTDSIVLNLNSNQISDLTPLRTLTQQMELHLRNNQISDLTPLQSLTNLRYLDLCNNQISDLTPLKSLTNLNKLYIENNSISDFKPLLSLTHLNEFKISFTSEHKTLIENSRRKWETLANSTKPIDRAQATAAVNAVYKAIGLAAPAIVFCDSLPAGFAQLQRMKESLKCIKWFDRLDRQVRNLLRPLTLMTELQQKLMGLVLRWEEQLFQKVKENVSDYWDYSRSKVPRKYLVESLTLLDFYVFSLGIVFTAESQQLVQSLMRLLAECGWVFAFENVCIVCSRPTKLSLDREFRLHAVGESALEFADGCKLYAIDGVTLPEKYGEIHPQHWQSQWLLEEKNAGLKRILIQGIGYDRICQELEAIELDTWQEYTLLKIDFEDDYDRNNNTKPLFLLKMTCPSTGFVHALRVTPEMTSAREAVRWVNWDIDRDEFSVQT